MQAAPSGAGRRGTTSPVFLVRSPWAGRIDAQTLLAAGEKTQIVLGSVGVDHHPIAPVDRKSTRLNSSHRL